jgi:pimeloyl-ACP methyl ester carboxylesterase
MVATDDGTRIEYEVYGSGPLPILFLHGWGNAASFWRHLFVEFMDLTGLRCIAASYRGHGNSDPALAGYTHERFARDMFAVADAVGADRLVIVGFSMAGKFCRYMSYLKPARILGQVLIAPVGPNPLAAPRAAFEPWVEAASDPERFRPIFEQFIARPVREDLALLYCENVARATRVALEGTIEMFYVPIENEVSAINPPTLIMVGESDPLLGPDYAKEHVLSSAPGARIVVLPCSHEIPVELPRETAWMLQAFVAGLYSSAGMRVSA